MPCCITEVARRRRRIPGVCGIVAWAMLSAVACADTVRAPEPLDVADEEEAGSPSEAAMQRADPVPPRESLGPMEMAPVGVDPTRVRDACLVDSCDTVELPLQPPVPFLEEMGDGWLRLTEIDWALAPNTEGYRCAALTFPSDLAVAEFSPQNPPGTLHASGVVQDTVSHEDGAFPCQSLQPAGRRLPDSGAGSSPFAYPEGAYFSFRAGEQLIAQWHLANPGERALRGRSGIWIRLRPEAEQEHEVETVLVGPLSLEVPPGHSTVSGACSFTSATTLVSLLPYMRQLGAAVRVTAVTAAGEQVLHDGPYDFLRQDTIDLAPIPLDAGDQLRVECTYDNDSDRTARWGFGMLDEVCYVGVAMYPPAGFGSLPCF